MKNYNLASAVTVSEESGAISGNQWLPEMPGKTEQGKLNLIKKKSGYWSNRQYRKKSQFITGWGHWMVTQRCRQRILHEMSYTIKFRVKTRMATGVAVSTERAKLLNGY